MSFFPFDFELCLAFLRRFLRFASFFYVLRPFLGDVKDADFFPGILCMHVVYYVLDVLI